MLRCIMFITDIILINICFAAGCQLSARYGGGFAADLYRYNLIIVNLTWILSTGINRLYFKQGSHSLEAVYKFTWRSAGLHIFIFLLFLFFSNQTNFPRLFFVIFYTGLSSALLISRFAGTALTSLLNKNYDVRKAVAVLGMNSAGLKLAEYLLKQNSLRFVGFLDNYNNYIHKHNKNVIRRPSVKEQLKAAADSGIEEVYISVDAHKMNDLADLIKEGERNCIRLKFVPDLSALESKFKMDTMGNFTVLCARQEPLEDIRNRFKKRLFDIVVSLGVIVFIFSWLYPLLAIIIKLQSPGPVFFAQLRSGRNNRPFWCYKFRSMVVNNDSDHRQASLNDKRITSIGSIMRKTSLDEFPQFFNVLMGYMSICGPRPHMLSHTNEYRKIIDKYMVRHFLKPGITGWAQINGYRGETKDPSLMEKRVEHDIWYMENWSVMLDLKIVFLTIINIFKGEKNAY